MVLLLSAVTPDLIDVVVSAAVPPERERANKIKSGDRRIPPIGLALAILLQEYVMRYKGFFLC